MEALDWGEELVDRGGKLMLGAERLSLAIVGKGRWQ